MGEKIYRRWGRRKLDPYHDYGEENAPSAKVEDLTEAHEDAKATPRS